MIDKCGYCSAPFLGNYDSNEDYIPEFMEQLNKQVNEQLGEVLTKENLPPVPKLDSDPNKPTVDAKWE